MALTKFYKTLEDPIFTDRLILRCPIINDAKAISTLANNKKIYDMLARLPFPYEENHAIEFINEIARTNDEHAYAICLKNNQLIGLISFAKYEDKIEIGYWLGEEFWNKGYASEAAKGLIKTAIASANCPPIIARSISSNKASINLLEKIGFSIVEEKIDDCGIHNGVMVTHLKFNQ